MYSSDSTAEYPFACSCRASFKSDQLSDTSDFNEFLNAIGFDPFGGTAAFHHSSRTYPDNGWMHVCRAS
jgi:hypothetical protein